MGVDSGLDTRGGEGRSVSEVTCLPTRGRGGDPVSDVVTLVALGVTEVRNPRGRTRTGLGSRTVSTQTGPWGGPERHHPLAGPDEDHLLPRPL